MGDFKDSFNCCTDPGNIDWAGHSRTDLYCISDSDRDRNCFFYSFQIMIRKIKVSIKKLKSLKNKGVQLFYFLAV